MTTFILGGISLALGAISLWLGVSSNRQMSALSNCMFDEKLAAMAYRLDEMKSPKSRLEIEGFLNDLAAATSLVKYVSKSLQSQVVQKYTIPLLDRCKKEGIAADLQAPLQGIIDLALAYHINEQQLQELQRDFRTIPPRSA